MDNVDVFVNLNDGSRWSASIITLAQVEILMKRWAASGEALAGRYFWCSDGLIVRDAGISNMTQVLAQVVIDADTRLVVAAGRPLLGNRNDCKSWELSGRRTPSATPR